MCKTRDNRIGKSIGTSSNSDIKCISNNMVIKVFSAEIYPCLGDLVQYYDENSEQYMCGTVKKYKTPLSMVVQCVLSKKEYNYTLRKNGKWIIARDKGLYNIFDIKYMYELRGV